MSYSSFIAVFVGFAGLLIGAFIGYRKGANSAVALAEQKREESERQVTEARNRENEAKAREQAAAERLATSELELKKAIEERGRYASDASRVEEARIVIAQKEEQLRVLNERITELERARSAALKEAQAAKERADELIAKEREVTTVIVSAKDDQIAKLNEFIGNAQDVLSKEFKAISADTLKDASEQLIKTADSLIKKHGETTTGDVALHREQIKNMLQPVEETIKRLDKHVEDSDQARSNAQAVLDEQVRRLASASESLSNALQKPVVRGSWGEMTLENALESAGLEPEIDFILQDQTDAEDGQKRTDAVVNLPKGRKLIIDSKNLMKTYVALMQAQDPIEKAALLESHSKSLRSHVKSLSSKEYWRRYEGLDCVILFIPHDGMYHAAIQDESEVIRDASEKRVFIANPMTLIPLLKAVRYVLDQERLNKHAEEIKAVGTELYSVIARFAGNFAGIGDRLRSTVHAYNAAIPALDRFIVSKSRKLKQLGAGKGADAELPDEIDLEPRSFSSRELRDIHTLPTQMSLDAAAVDEPRLVLAAEAETEEQSQAL